MAVRNKITHGIDLIKLNTVEDVFGKDDLYKKCIMCREEMTQSEQTKEHIFPRWLQKRYNLETQKMILPNGTTMKYNQILVPCCEKCNGGIMSEWEEKIRNGVEGGYDEFIKIDVNVIAWWIYKIYYAKLVKETQLKSDIRSSTFSPMINEEQISKYNNIYMVMSNLIKGISYEGKIPYEIYVFRTEKGAEFNYFDDIITHTVYMQMGDIAIICSLDSYNIYAVQYKRELESLGKLEKIHQCQAIELFTKMVFFRMHYGFNTKETCVIDSRRCYMKTEVFDLSQIKEFDLEQLHILLVESFKLLGLDLSNKVYEEGKMISLIP